MNPRLVNRGLRPTGRLMLLVILATFFVLFIMVGASFARIAITGMAHGHDLHDRAERYQRNTRTVPGRRGHILDRYGDVFATQHRAYTIYANFRPDWGTVIDVENLEETAYLLSTVINMEAEDILANLELNIANGVYQSRFGHAGQRLLFLQRRQIEALGISGIGFIPELIRFYPQGVFASHTIGYTRFGRGPEYDEVYGALIGAMGLETHFNDILTGSDGLYEIRQDRTGIAQPGTDRTYLVDPRDGYDITLTLSSTIQMFLENAMEDVMEQADPENITAIVMNARTGEILAAASRPTFDPNERNPLTYANDIMYQFEPGSTFKIFTYAAAMNEGLYQGDDTFLSGRRYLNAYPLPDMRVDDHPLIERRQMTFDEGFWISTNTSAIDLIRDSVSRHRFTDYIHAFGFGQPTGLPLPNEHRGRISNPNTHSTDVYMSAFGQAIDVTPIQLLQATTAILNDGAMVRPQLIKGIFNPNTNEIIESFEREVIGQPITAETARQMRELMVGVVHSEEGTGRIHYLLDIPSGGKTGTAEVFNPTTGLYHYNVHIYNYIGFAPADNPEIVMFVAVKNPRTTTHTNGHPYAGQIYRFVMNNTLSYLGYIEHQMADDSVALPEFQRTAIPNVLNMTVHDATTLIKDAGFDVYVIGNNTTIFNQLPPADTVAIVGEKVFLQTDTTAQVPDFTGWTGAQIRQYGILLGIEIEIIGTGTAHRQSIRAGRRVQSGDTMRVNLRQ